MFGGPAYGRLASCVTRADPLKELCGFSLAEARLCEDRINDDAAATRFHPCVRQAFAA
jgi:hypothetical protein